MSSGDCVIETVHLVEVFDGFTMGRTQDKLQVLKFFASGIRLSKKTPSFHLGDPLKWEDGCKLFMEKRDKKGS